MTPKGKPPAVMEMRPYMSGHILVLEIQNTIVRVLRELFARSPIFRDMFSMPQAPGVIPEGTDDTHPLRLQGIGLDDFQLFVRAATASEIIDCPLPLLNCEELSRVHALARLWDMDVLRQQIYMTIPTRFSTAEDAAQLMYLAVQLEQYEWLEIAIWRLVARLKSLSAEEMDILGLQFSAHLIRMREAYTQGMAVARHESLHRFLYAGETILSKNVENLMNVGPPIINNYLPFFIPPPTQNAIRAAVEMCKAGCFS